MIYLIIALGVIGVILSLPSVKGYLGELRIRLWLKFLDKKKYRIINDVMIPAGEGKTSQIDHIIVSIYGIFVIETKNYRGWIFGNENGKNWTQVIYKSKNQFYNPILQNRGHVRALKELLANFPDLVYIPIVAFTLKANFKKLNVTSHVVQGWGLNRTIKKYSQKIISYEDLKTISKSILSANDTDRLARKQHVSRIKEEQGNKSALDSGKCPRCGKTLKERSAPYVRIVVG